MPEHTVGLDVHSKFSVFTIQRTVDGHVTAQGQVPTDVAGLTKLRDEHQLAADTPVGLETGTVSFFVARTLTRLGLKALVIDAAEVRLKAQRPNQKCDQRDAFEICDGVRRGIYRCIVHVPSVTVSRARDTLSRRRHFVRSATREINAAKRLLRSAGLKSLATVSLTTEIAWAKLLAKLATEDDLRLYVEQHRAAWQCAQTQITQLNARVAALQKHDELQAGVDLLQTIPGVGPIIALTLVAGFSDVDRFPSAKHAASYVGLTPSTYSSGEREVSGHITKCGSPEMRAMLCEAAHHAAQPTHPLYPYFAAHSAKHGYKMAITATAHRLCRIAFRMLRTKSAFDATKLNVAYEPHLRTKEVCYRRKDKPLPRGSLNCKTSAPPAPHLAEAPPPV